MYHRKLFSKYFDRNLGDCTYYFAQIYQNWQSCNVLIYLIQQKNWFCGNVVYIILVHKHIVSQSYLLRQSKQILNYIKARLFWSDDIVYSFVLSLDLLCVLL